jgi:7-cyano-7-deazaguanine synthase
MKNEELKMKSNQGDFIAKNMNNFLSANPEDISERDAMRTSNAALVLFSGGQDSATCLFWALKYFERVEAVCFRYGQRHSSEIEAAQSIAQKAGVLLRIVNAEIIAGLSRNSLTDMEIVMDREQTGDLPPNTFVPGRNLLFISMAAIIARENKISNIITGVSQADYSGYPDCRDTFVRSLNVTLNLAMDEQFVIHTPLMRLDKKAVWQLAGELEIFELVKNETVTCYNGIPGSGCGDCPSCKLRKNGLEEYENSRNRLS